MYPVLFKIGWFEVHSFGIMLLIAFIVGINLAMRRAKKVGIAPDIVVDLSIVLIVAGLAGARAMYVAFHLEEFEGRMLDTISPIQSDGTVGIAGLTVLGGILLALISSLIFLRYKKAQVIPVFNVIAPMVALGFAIARWGCFLHGCCFGTVSDSAWAVTFPVLSPAGAVYPGLALHPAQIYASLGGAISFILLLLSERISYFKNTAIFTFLILYGFSRFIVDIFRYYETSMVLFYIGDEKISVNQGLSVLLIIFGISGIIYYNKKLKSKK